MQICCVESRYSLVVTGNQLHALSARFGGEGYPGEAGSGDKPKLVLRLPWHSPEPKTEDRLGPPDNVYLGGLPKMRRGVWSAIVVFLSVVAVVFVCSMGLLAIWHLRDGVVPGAMGRWGWAQRNWNVPDQRQWRGLPGLGEPSSGAGAFCPWCGTSVGVHSRVWGGALLIVLLCVTPLLGLAVVIGGVAWWAHRQHKCISPSAPPTSGESSTAPSETTPSTGGTQA